MNKIKQKETYDNVWLSRISRKNKTSELLYEMLVTMLVLPHRQRSSVKESYCSMLSNFSRMVERGVDILYVNARKEAFDEPTIIDGAGVANSFGYEVFITVLNSLESSELIERSRGYRNNEGDWIPGYLTLTEDFKFIITSCIKSRNGRSEVKRSSLVITDGETGKPKLFTRGKKSMSHVIVTRMQQYNKFLSTHDIRIGDVKVTPWLCRIFKDNLQTHGRLYNIGEHLNYQTLASSKRCAISINGEKTVELDYKHLHPSLLYQEVGEIIEGDVYMINIDYAEIFEEDLSNSAKTYPFQMRNLVKGAMLRMLNTDSKVSCAKSIEKMLRENKNGFPDIKNDYRKIAKYLMEAIELKHRKISQCFYVEHSLTLMYFDSTILTIVLSMCFDEQIVALPVHDSLIVKVCDAQRVEELMHFGYAEFMGNSLNCHVEVK